jgi:hypothetical protein
MKAEGDVFIDSYLGLLILSTQSSDYRVSRCNDTGASEVRGGNGAEQASEPLLRRIIMRHLHSVARLQAVGRSKLCQK